MKWLSIGFDIVQICFDIFVIGYILRKGKNEK